MTNLPRQPASVSFVSVCSAMPPVFIPSSKKTIVLYFSAASGIESGFILLSFSTETGSFSPSTAARSSENILP